MKEVKTQVYVKLQLLTGLWTDDVRWQKNVLNSVGAKGYTFACENDDDAVEQRFAVRNMKKVNSVRVYDFAGSLNMDERFYERAIEVFKNISTGEFWVANVDGLWEF